MPNHYSVAVIPGDGIGVDVINEGVRVLDHLADVTGTFRLDYERFDWSTARYFEHGSYMPADWTKVLQPFQTIYFGAVGWPTVPDHISLWGLLLPIRKAFDQYANVRPVRLLPGLRGRLVGKGAEHIDFVCVRENTEGEYSGVGGRVHRGTPHEVAIQDIVFTRMGTERIIRYAFEYAVTRGRKSVQSVTKSNAMQFSAVFWDDVFDEVALEYPAIATQRYLVDAMAARFVTHPESLDVVVASNLFADILTDLGGAIQGSMGMPPSANIDPTRRHPSLFEPVHGSAPDIAGKGIANPLGTIWAGQMMLDFLGETEAARLLMQAIEAVTQAGTVLTPDLGGTAATGQVTDAVIAALTHAGR
ncbi:MAG: tartrate dehydrogenase [Proteobacteria bacterium]|jgi:tartrate dehydrogenase/decarboxylase/D-malate dehydrogenase|nr:tartrate dehydrogenase [Pseudomonadota bacterium]NBY47663.1 tartrate dehydrogenase [Pseudomonadota bacterium]NDB71475.1 tartrate dehydrogenase [Pseudomonadota bacterium]NDF10146.1 tartrate dehydrogenase [Pseudomonadota bacterium]NDG96827.1 tartrate dehydrogenase [Pseudomonadota bacterium]